MIDFFLKNWFRFIDVVNIIKCKILVVRKVGGGLW